MKLVIDLNQPIALQFEARRKQEDERAMLEKTPLEIMEVELAGESADMATKLTEVFNKISTFSTVHTLQLKWDISSHSHSTMFPAFRELPKNIHTLDFSEMDIDYLFIVGKKIFNFLFLKKLELKVIKFSDSLLEPKQDSEWNELFEDAPSGFKIKVNAITEEGIQEKTIALTTKPQTFISDIPSKKGSDITNEDEAPLTRIEEDQNGVGIFHLPFDFDNDNDVSSPDSDDDAPLHPVSLSTTPSLISSDSPLNSPSSLTSPTSSAAPYNSPRTLPMSPLTSRNSPSLFPSPAKTNGTILSLLRRSNTSTGTNGTTLDLSRNNGPK